MIPTPPAQIKAPPGGWLPTTPAFGNTAPVATSGPVSAKDAHDMIIGSAFGIVLIVLAIILAGQSTRWGNAMILLMVLLLLVQGITHVSVFASFVQKNQFLPTT